MKLCDLKEGEVGIVQKINFQNTIARRLLDIGLIQGTKVECALISSLKNPKAYLIRGALIAIRNEDAQNVEVKWLKNGMQM